MGSISHKITWFLINQRMKSHGLKRKFLSIPVTLILNSKGSYIGSRAIFKNEPIFPHGFTGFFVSSDSRIGEGATIFHHVTIGSNTLGDSEGKGSPTIGDNCYIGAGAKIIGGIKIGNNVRIGANAVVVKDVPDNAVVVNQPSRVILKEDIRNKWQNVDKLQN